MAHIWTVPLRTVLPILVLVSAAHAQVVRTIPDEPTCGDCEIVMRKLVTLGTTGDVFLMRGSHVAVDSEGRLFVGPTYTPGEIVMYDRTGRLLRRFGRRGQGPGEFESIDRLRVGPGDTIHVFDYVRHTMLAAGLSGFVSTTVAPIPPYQLAFLSDGRMVASHMVLDSHGIGEPLHIIDRKGNIVQSFGGTGSWNPREIYRALRAIAPARDDGIWSAWIPEYRIELWTSNGKNPLTLVRDADWFRPWSVEDLKTPTEGLRRPRVSEMTEDDQGRLWVTVAVPNPDWDPPSTRGELPMKELDPNKMFDTVIEVLDPEEGRVVARGKWKGMLIGFIGAGDLVYTKKEDPDGNTLIDVWRVLISHEPDGRTP